MAILARNPDLDYVRPDTQVYIGLWCLQVGATAFLAARLWTKLTRRHGVWWDDYILMTTWVRKDYLMLASELHADFRTGGPYNQRHHHHCTIRHRLRDPVLGYSNAHTHRHNFLSHSAWPESLEDSLCSNITEVDERRQVAARHLMVLHHNDERMESCKGTKAPEVIPL